MSTTKQPARLIGAGIFNLVTTGMYSTPLAMYREYIQNSADAIASCIDGPAGHVQVAIDPTAATVTIRDNGPGLGPREAVAALVPVADSGKRRGRDRGFRGVGRLAALAYADSVTFLTRAGAGTPLCRVVWDAPKLRNHLSRSRDTERAIRECVEVGTFQSNEHPDHFFEVQIDGVGRHVANQILNRDAVRRYIAEVCPVPFGNSFPLADATNGFLQYKNAFFSLRVCLDAEPDSIVRPHGDLIGYSETKAAGYTDLETITIPALDETGDSPVAVGWVAHTPYLGTIPKTEGVRGIRAREGNLQIGDEDVFNHLFQESRFNRWCVGEIHVLDPRITPNDRRDYFASSPHVRHLENHLSACFHRLAARCRQASAARNAHRRLQSCIQECGEAYDLAVSGFLSACDAASVIDGSLHKLSKAHERLVGTAGHIGVDLRRFEAIDRKLRKFVASREPALFDGMSEPLVTTYQKIFRALNEASESPRVALDMIKTIAAETSASAP